MLIIHNPPQSERLYKGYTVSINGQTVPTPEVRVSAMPYNTAWPGYQRPLDQTETAPLLMLEADEDVRITVTYKNSPSEVLIRPLIKGVSASIKGNTATFTLTCAGAYTVEADGFHEALHIFINPIKDFEEYTTPGKTILRYGAGVHNIGNVELFSNTTVIIDRDAYLYGSFFAADARDVSICGYGVLDGSYDARGEDTRLIPHSYDFLWPRDRAELISTLDKYNVQKGILRFYNCENIRVEGVCLRDASTFAAVMANCTDIVFENVKTIGMWKYNSDGIDLFNSSDAVIRDCFFRNFDDCIALKGICGWDLQSVENILVERCVTWCDWGRNLEIGAETNAPLYRNIIFRDCDCIHGATIFCDIQHHNCADISHVTFEDIRCEYTRHQLGDVYQTDMNMPYSYTVKHPVLCGVFIYNMGLFSKNRQNGNIHDIAFKNITVMHDADSIPNPEIVLQGISEEYKVSRVHIENINKQGKRLAADEITISQNKFVEDVTVR